MRGLQFAQSATSQSGWVRSEFLTLAAAGGHCHHLRSNGPAAANIVRRVAHYDDLLAPQILTEHAAAPISRDSGDLIAIFVIISNPPVWNRPTTEPSQFKFRTEPDVARQQTINGGSGSAWSWSRNPRTRGWSDRGCAEAGHRAERRSVRRTAGSWRRPRNAVGLKDFRTSPISVRPANLSCAMPSTPNSAANACANALTPAPPVRMSVPSISKKTSRTMRAQGYGAPRALANSLTPSIVFYRSLCRRAARRGTVHHRVGFGRFARIVLGV